jgi:hypothetical protein
MNNLLSSMASVCQAILSQLTRIKITDILSLMYSDHIGQPVKLKVSAAFET